MVQNCALITKLEIVVWHYVLKKTNNNNGELIMYVLRLGKLASLTNYYTRAQQI